MLKYKQCACGRWLTEAGREEVTGLLHVRCIMERGQEMNGDQVMPVDCKSQLEEREVEALKERLQSAQEALRGVAAREVDGHLCWCPGDPEDGFHAPGCTHASSALDEDSQVGLVPFDEVEDWIARSQDTWQDRAEAARAGWRKGRAASQYEIRTAHEVLTSVGARVTDALGTLTVAGRIQALLRTNARELQDSAAILKAMTSQRDDLARENGQLAHELDNLRGGFDAVVSANARLERERDAMKAQCEEARAIAATYREQGDRMERELARALAGESERNRVSALVEALYQYFEEGGDYQDFILRLAALRGPDALIAERDGLRTRLAALRAPGVELRQCPECDCDPAALATTRRELDEAAEVLRDWVDWRDKHGLKDDQLLESALWPVIARARALVAGEVGGTPPPGADPEAVDWKLTCAARDAEIEDLREQVQRQGTARKNAEQQAETALADLARAEAALGPDDDGRSLGARIEELVECYHGTQCRAAELCAEVESKDRGIEAIRARCNDLIADRDALRARLDAAGKLIERAGDLVEKANGDDGYPIEVGEVLLADLRAWGKQS